MRSISLLVKDDLKSPPLALLLPRASLRAKDTETVKIAYNKKVSALDQTSVEWNTTTVHSSMTDFFLERGALERKEILSIRQSQTWDQVCV